MKVLALLGSTRENGNSEYLAKKIAEGTDHTLVKLTDLQIEPIVDQRHADGALHRLMTTMNN